MLDAARFDAMTKLFEDYAASVAEIPTMSFGRPLRVPAAAWDRMILSEGYPLTPRVVSTQAKARSDAIALGFLRSGS
jgi:hypothetical protein